MPRPPNFLPTMNRYKQQFAELSSEYLLQRRALGDELDDEAHAAIEAIFRERGEPLPPRPRKPIIAPDPPRPESAGQRRIKIGFMLLLAALTMAISKYLGHTWLGVVIVVALAVRATFSQRTLEAISTGERTPEQTAEYARKEGISDLMLAAAEGDISRLNELIGYGHDVNATTLVGTTALMYAARNNRADCIHLLLAAGANRDTVSEKGSTALSIAEKFGYREAAEALK